LSKGIEMQVVIVRAKHVYQLRHFQQQCQFAVI